MEMRHDRLNGDKIMCTSVISQGVCVFVVCMYICVFVQTVVTNNFFCLWPLRYVPYKYLKNVFTFCWPIFQWAPFLCMAATNTKFED